MGLFWRRPENRAACAAAYPFAGIHCDVGPGIGSAKNAAVLDMMVRLLGDNVHKLRRSSKIFHDGRFIKYPFENELSALSAPERDYCLNTFLNNPYETYAPESPAGIFTRNVRRRLRTNLYLRPYDEKIWKFDPAFMDTQMVERIPKPPRGNIIKSAQGITGQGYVRAPIFIIPKRGGIQSLLDAFLKQLGNKVAIHTGTTVRQVVESASWLREDADGRDDEKVV